MMFFRILVFLFTMNLCLSQAIASFQCRGLLATERSTKIGLHKSFWPQHRVTNFSDCQRYKKKTADMSEFFKKNINRIEAKVLKASRQYKFKILPANSEFKTERRTPKVNKGRRMLVGNGFRFCKDNQSEFPCIAEVDTLDYKVFFIVDRDVSKAMLDKLGESLWKIK